MGVSTVVFSIFYAVLVQPLAFRDSVRLVQIWETRNDRGINQASFTEANFWDVRAQSQTFEDVAAYYYGEANLDQQRTRGKSYVYGGERGVLPHARCFAGAGARLLV